MPSGLHSCTLADVQAGLVDKFPTSSTRSRIFQGLGRYIADLETLGISGKLWLDGSFATGKAHPGDVDLMSLVSFDLLNRLSPAIQNDAIQLLRGGKRTQPHYAVDSYCVFCVPSSHPAYANGVDAFRYWRNFFGHTRKWLDQNGNEINLAKGMLDLPFGDPSEVAVIDNWVQNII